MVVISVRTATSGRPSSLPCTCTSLSPLFHLTNNRDTNHTYSPRFLPPFPPPSSSSVWDCILIAIFYAATIYAESLIAFETLPLPYSWILPAVARFVIWSLYGFATGLVATGLWVIAHECGHQAFSESKTLNHTVGWVLHSACVCLSFPSLTSFLPFPPRDICEIYVFDFFFKI